MSTPEHNDLDQPIQLRTGFAIHYLDNECLEIYKGNGPARLTIRRDELDELINGLTLSKARLDEKYPISDGGK